MPEGFINGIYVGYFHGYGCAVFPLRKLSGKIPVKTGSVWYSQYGICESEPFKPFVLFSYGGVHIASYQHG